MTAARRTRRTWIAMVWLAGCALAICGSHAVAAAQGARPSPSGLVIRDAWLRESTATRTVSSGYMTVENRTAHDVTLTGVTVAGAKRADIHTVRHENGQGGMQAVPDVRIPAHSSVALEPGGTHIMIFDVTPPFVRGRHVTMRLTFGGRSSQTVRAVVRPLSATSAR
jgi:copper(I)-binding protein